MQGRQSSTWVPKLLYLSCSQCVSHLVAVVMAPANKHFSNRSCLAHSVAIRMQLAGTFSQSSLSYQL